jgi:hypothetical protein
MCELLWFCSAGLLAVCVTAHSVHVATVLLADDLIWLNKFQCFLTFPLLQSYHYPCLIHENISPWAVSFPLFTELVTCELNHGPCVYDLIRPCLINMWLRIIVFGSYWLFHVNHDSFNQLCGFWRILARLEGYGNCCLVA